MDDEEYEDDDETTATSTHKCLICGKRYAKEMSFYAHITSHSQDILNSQRNSPTSNNKKVAYTVVDTKNSRTRLYNCKSCDFSTPLLKSIKLHSRSHLVSTNKENRSPEDHSISSRFASNASKLKNHNETEDPEYKCEECDETFTLKQEFDYHKADCSSGDPSYQCDVCYKKYRDKNGLKSHIKIHVEPGESVIIDTADDKFFECDFCKKCFPSKKHITLHLRTHAARRKKGRPKKSDEIKTEPDVKIPRRKRVRLEKPFKCDEENCQYATSQYSLLKAHKFKHNPFYKCVTCQEKFPTRLELKNHMSTHGERPFKCDQCNKCYKDKHGLGWHKKVQHDPSRLKFTCELCGKTYPFDSLLTQHINLSHATEKQSVCDICGKNVSKTYLPMHRRTHGEKQYSCDICEKTFLEKAYLKRHKMVHTGEKPYVCSVCGNSFRQHSTLTIHMRTHTGDRPYKCVLCENAYKTHHNLKKHYKRSGHKLV